MFNKYKKTNEYKAFLIKLFILSGFLILCLLIYSLLDFLILFLFSIFLAILFVPFLNKMNKYKIPDFIGIFIIYLILIWFIVLAFFAIIPIFIKQTILFVDFIKEYIVTLQLWYEKEWIKSLPLPNFAIIYFDKFLLNIDFNSILNSLKDNFSSISQFLAKNIFSIASSSTSTLINFWSAILNFFTILILTFFMILERKEIRNFFYDIIPSKTSKYLLSKEEKIVWSMYEWIKWQMILWISIFMIVFISLNILKLFWIDMWSIFTLALIAWLMEFIPYLWPILALLPALAIAAWISFNAVIVILIIYLIIQQIENNVLVPYVMSKSLDLSPFFVLVMMIIWASLFWILWIIIAIPIRAVINIFINDYLDNRRNK